MDIKTGEIKRSVNLPDNFEYKLTFLSNQDMLILNIGKVKLFNTQDLQEIFEIPTGTEVNLLAVSKDQSLLATPVRNACSQRLFATLEDTAHISLWGIYP